MEFSLGPFTLVGTGVYAAVAEPASVNIGLVVGADCALVIDAGSTPAQGQEILAQAQAMAGVPVKYALVTHWHWDHYFGLVGFGSAADLTSLGHETLDAWLSRPELAFEAQKLKVPVADLAGPSVPVADVLTLELGGTLVEVGFYGRGHTDGDLVAFIPSRNVLFAGDLVEESGPPVVDFDSFVEEWPGTLRRILARLDDETTIVPGHGKPVSTAFVRAQAASL